MFTAASAIKQARAQELPTAFKESVLALNTACRAKAADDELAALKAADAALKEFLELANGQKFDVRPRDDINAFDGASGILYNKFLFRSG